MYSCTATVHNTYKGVQIYIQTHTHIGACKRFHIHMLKTICMVSMHIYQYISIYTNASERSSGRMGNICIDIKSDWICTDGVIQCCIW